MIFGNFAEWNIQNILIRILVATILGTIIGFDRGMKHRAAGTKTITVPRTCQYDPNGCSSN